MNNELEEKELTPNKQDISAMDNSVYGKSSYDTPQKERVRRYTHSLKGLVGNGTHGGFITPMTFMEYLGGTPIDSIEIDTTVKMQPIKHISLDKLKLRVDAVYVPNSAVWDKADEFVAQRSNAFSSPISYPMVNFNGIANISLTSNDGQSRILYHMSTLFRDTVLFNYYGHNATNPNNNFSTSLIILAGYFSAYNKIYSPKNFVPPIPFDNVDNLSAQLLFSGNVSNDINVNSMIQNTNYHNICLQRAPASRSYYNDYRIDVVSDNSPVDNTSLYSHVVTQKMIDEYRMQSSNAVKTDEQVIAELRGTRVANENIPYIIASDTVPISLSIEPQSVEGELLLGDEGAISYTDVKLNLPVHFNAVKDGYIHIFYYVQANDNIIDPNAVPIDILKSEFSDFYRPGLSEIKDSPLFLSEITQTNDNSQIIGYKRRYSEYTRLPNIIRGDYTSMQPTIVADDGMRHNNNGWSFINESVWAPQEQIGTFTNAVWMAMSPYQRFSALVTVGSPVDDFLNTFAPNTTFNNPNFNIGMRFVTPSGNTEIPLQVLRMSYTVSTSNQKQVSIDVNQSQFLNDLQFMLENGFATGMDNNGTNLWVNSAGALDSTIGYVEDKSDWHLLTPLNESVNITLDDAYAYNNQTDYTDVAMTKLLINVGADFRNTTIIPSARKHRSQTNQTFYMYGTVTINCSQPIDSDVFTNFIEFGEE